MLCRVIPSRFMVMLLSFLFVSLYSIMFYQALPVQMQTGPAGLRMLLATRLKLLDKGPAAGFVLLNEDSAAGLVTGIG